MNIPEGYIDSLMAKVRVKSATARTELTALVGSAVRDLDIAGVYVTDLEEPLCERAITLYCKANYGYDSDSEKFRAAYAALKDAMALSGDYPKVGGDLGG